MSSTLLDEEIRDTNTYDGSIDRSRGTETGSLFHVVSGLDAEVTITFYGTRAEDENNNDIEQLGQLTIASGGSGYETLSDPWEKVYVEVVATAAPGSGSVVIYKMP